MSESLSVQSADCYVNPVYPRNFPDPFVLRFNGIYYAYGTDVAGDGRAFPMLSSRDLVHWTEHGGAVPLLDLPGAELYWAPEVAYHEGKFYLYYATGREANPDHHLRVAVAEHPLGPWLDAGVNLTPDEIFAIDAHPYRDPRDGQWYLYYARDSLTPPYAGTGLAVDRLVTMERLAGEPVDVLRPHADWQVFELKRAVKGGLDWYTIEGPFVLLRDGRYVCLYSGGRYEAPNYGVGYALADQPLGPWVDDANAAGPVVLTTAPGRVIGPGHNSVVKGPDLRTDYMIYHGWDPEWTARSLRIDVLHWHNGRPHCHGPTTTPMPVPDRADVDIHFATDELGDRWDADGWDYTADGIQAITHRAELMLCEPETDFIAELSARGRDSRTGYGFRIGDMEVRVEAGVLKSGSESAPLPEDFRIEVWHQMTVVRERGYLQVTLDAYPTLRAPLPDGEEQLTLYGDAGVRFAHFALTRLG